MGSWLRWPSEGLLLMQFHPLSWTIFWFLSRSRHHWVEMCNTRCVCVWLSGGSCRCVNGRIRMRLGWGSGSLKGSSLTAFWYAIMHGKTLGLGKERNQVKYYVFIIAWKSPQNVFQEAPDCPCNVFLFLALRTRWNLSPKLWERCRLLLQLYYWKNRDFHELQVKAGNNPASAL